MQISTGIRSVAAAIAVASAVAGCGAHAPGAGGPQPGVARTMTLQPCRVAGIEEEVRCGTLEVFEDRAARTGRRIPLKVVVLPARGRSPAPDPLFVLAGGPGEAATNMSAFMAREFPRLRETREIVLVDQRGTGASNRLQCSLGALNDRIHAVMTMAVRDEALRECIIELRRHADLRLYTTPIAMDDLDEVRAALGYRTINLYGGSYGTRAAFVYMRRHPRRVRAVVMRAIAPVTMRALLPAARHGQVALDGLVADCRKDAACASGYPAIREELAQLLALLARTPVNVDVPGAPPADARVHVTRDLFAGSIPFLLSQPEGAAAVPWIVQRARAGDFGPFAAAVAPVGAGYTEFLSLGMALSVLCAEDGAAIRPRDLAGATAGSFLGDHRVRNQLATCAAWPRGSVPPSYYEPVRSAAPVLMISGEYDPIDGLDLAREAARSLPNALHVIIPSGTHQPQFPGCLTAVMQEFVARGTTAGLDASCARQIRRQPFVGVGAAPPRAN